MFSSIHPRKQLIPVAVASLALLLPSGTVVASAVSPDDSARQAPNALYRMANAKFVVKARTNGAGNIKSYEATYRKTTCRIRGFKWSVQIPDPGFDASGFTYNSTLTPRLGGRVYQVKVFDRGRIAGEKFVLKEKLLIRPRGSKKAWCTVKKTHVAYRSYS